MGRSCTYSSRVHFDWKVWRRKQSLIRTPGTPTTRGSVSALWGPKSLDGIVDLDLIFAVERDKHAIHRISGIDGYASLLIFIRHLTLLTSALCQKCYFGCRRYQSDSQRSRIQICRRIRANGHGPPILLCQWETLYIAEGNWPRISM